MRGRNAELRTQNAEVTTDRSWLYFFILISDFLPHSPSVQNLSLKYLSPESHNTVTITACCSFFNCNCWAIFKLATTAAAAETPTSNPAVRDKRRAMA